MHIQNLVKFYHFVLKVLSSNKILNEILTSIKGDNSITKERKMMCNYLNLDLVNIIAYAKFGDNLYISSQDTERKRNCDGQKNGQPKSSIAPTFSNRGYNKRLGSGCIGVF